MKIRSAFVVLLYVYCKDPKKLNCAIAGLYQGQVSITQLGIPCQKWNTKEPHYPKVTPKAEIWNNFKIFESLEAAKNSISLKATNHNFCRNPDGDSKGPWCYTTNPSVRWGYCHILDCDTCEILNTAGSSCIPPGRGLSKFGSQT